MTVVFVNHFDRFKELASGAYGRVFVHPNDDTKVIKMGMLSDAWLTFATFVLASKPAPWLPIIHRVREYPGHGIYVAVIERLDTTAYDSGAEVRESWYAIERWWKYGCLELDAPIKALISFNLTGAIHTMERINKLADAECIGRDYHDQNVMLRGDQAVIIDPFYGNHNESSKTTARKYAVSA